VPNGAIISFETNNLKTAPIRGKNVTDSPRRSFRRSQSASAYEMLTKPEKLKAVQDSFKEAKAKEGK
jgi:hypothetical protein